MIWIKENGERINLHDCPLCHLGERVEKTGQVKKEGEAPEQARASNDARPESAR